MYREVIEHPAFDEFWRAISTQEQLDKVRIPVFSVGGWYDNYVQSDLEAFAALRKQSGVNRILVGPWAHNMSIPFENVDFGTESTRARARASAGMVRPMADGQGSPLAFQNPR